MAAVGTSSFLQGWVLNHLSCHSLRKTCHANLKIEGFWKAFSYKRVEKIGRRQRVSASSRYGDHEADLNKATRKLAIVERSESCNEEILLFFFQLDIATRLQRALNHEQYDTAQQLREKIVEVEHEVERQREAKMGTSSSKVDVQDAALAILRLRADLQKAVEGEDYAGAGRIRDNITQLEADSLVASAKALAYRNVKYTYRLGQRVKHKIYGYTGVICGMDPMCCESASWIESARVLELSRGKNQAFYQILVDVQQEPSLMVAYVAEDNIVVPSKAVKGEHFDHPYTYFLFYGMDSAGDFIPSKQLREKYNAARHELPEDHDSSGDSQNDGPT